MLSIFYADVRSRADNRGDRYAVFSYRWPGSCRIVCGQFRLLSSYSRHRNWWGLPHQRTYVLFLYIKGNISMHDLIYHLFATVIISELVPARLRGRMLAAGFAIFAFGMLSAGIVSAVVLTAFRAAIDRDPQNLDYAWR